MQSFLSILAIAAVSVVSKVSANTAGTGSCAAGIAAIGSTHLSYGTGSVPFRRGRMGTLEEGATVVQIGNITLEADTPSTFPANTDLTWTVTAFRIAYKGIFVRVEADASNTFTNVGNQADLQNAALCDALPDNVVGVSHTNAAAKATNSGVLNFSAEGSATMDISIVYDNTNTSVFAFSSFPLTIGTGAPTTAAPIPVVAPTPVAAPAPVVAPTPTAPTPVAVPVDATPTAVAPAGIPTAPAPVAAPTGTPPPAEAPVSEPTDPPTECPDDGEGKGMGGMKGMKGMMGMKCKGGMMMGMETKSKTPKSDGKGKLAKSKK
jgi:hypothetical protein